MKTYTAIAADGSAVTYRDRKRWLWLASLLYPLQPFIGIGMHALTGNEWWLVFPLLLNYAIAPALDWLVGEDQNNPPEEVTIQLDQDRYYRWLTWLAVPLHFITLLGCAAYSALAGLSPWGFIGLAVVAGLTAVPAYGHFWIEHNRGHHRDVATAADPASARMGESIYKFARREIPGAFLGAWRQERDRLERRGKSAWHMDNQILQSFAVSLGIAALLNNKVPKPGRNVAVVLSGKNVDMATFAKAVRLEASIQD